MRLHLFPNARDGPNGMLGNERLGIARGCFERGEILRGSNVPESDADIAQKAPALNAFYR